MLRDCGFYGCHHAPFISSFMSVPVLSPTHVTLTISFNVHCSPRWYARAVFACLRVDEEPQYNIMKAPLSTVLVGLQ